MKKMTILVMLGIALSVSACGTPEPVWVSARVVSRPVYVERPPVYVAPPPYRGY